MAALPLGLSVRPFRLDTDVLPLVQLLAETGKADGMGEWLTEAQVRLHLSVPHHDPGRDRRVIPHPDDPAALIGHAALYLPSGADDRRVADGMGVVHPKWRRQWLGSALFSTLENRLSEHTADVESLRLYIEARHEGAVAFASARGLEPNPADTYTEMHAVLADVTTQPVLPEGFTLRSYRDVNHLPTLVEALNRSYEGLSGHHRTTEADFAPHLAELNCDGLFLLFATGGSVAGEVSAELSPDLTERTAFRRAASTAPGSYPNTARSSFTGLCCFQVSPI